VRLAHKVAVIAGAWSAVAVAASMAAVRAVYITLEEVKGEPPLSDAPPQMWRYGDIVRNVETDDLVEVWGIDNVGGWFMDSAGTLYDVTDYVLFELNEEEA
jgi:hypothetical protein